MCDRCEIDMLLYGETAGCEAPVWEKGRFQAEAVEEKSPDRDAAEAEPDLDEQKPGREQE
jgi:hypothetical protein